MNNDTKSYLIIFGSYLGLALIVFLIGMYLGKRGNTDD